MMSEDEKTEELLRWVAFLMGYGLSGNIDEHGRRELRLILDVGIAARKALEAEQVTSENLRDVAARLYQLAMGLAQGHDLATPDELLAEARRVIGGEALARALLQLPYD